MSHYFAVSQYLSTIFRDQFWWTDVKNFTLNAFTWTDIYRDLGWMANKKSLKRIWMRLSWKMVLKIFCRKATIEPEANVAHSVALSLFEEYSQCNLVRTGANEKMKSTDKRSAEFLEHSDRNIAKICWPLDAVFLTKK